MRVLAYALSAILLVVQVGNCSPNAQFNVTYSGMSGQMEFVATDSTAIFRPTASAQRKLRQQGHRPADSFGDEAADCSTQRFRCYDAENAKVVFAVDLSALDRGVGYSFRGWRFNPICVSATAVRCEVSIIRFSHPKFRSGFFVFDSEKGVVVFGFVGKDARLQAQYALTTGSCGVLASACE